MLLKIRLLIWEQKGNKMKYCKLTIGKNEVTLTPANRFTKLIWKFIGFSVDDTAKDILITEGKKKEK